MKNSGTCPKCQERRIFHSGCVMDRGEGNEAQCLTIMRSDAIEARELGRFEVYVCLGCGYSELFVEDPSELEGR